MSICEDSISNLAILVNPPNLGGLALPRLGGFLKLQLQLHKFVKLGGLVLDWLYLEWFYWIGSRIHKFVKL